MYCDDLEDEAHAVIFYCDCEQGGRDPTLPDVSVCKVAVICMQMYFILHAKSLLVK